MAYAARHPGHAAKLILQSTAARLDVERIVAAFSEIGGPMAAEAARTFWTTHDNDSMMQYLQCCIPLYHSEPLTDQMTRCVLNPDLLVGFDGEMEMDLRPGLRGFRCRYSSWRDARIRSHRWARRRRSSGASRRLTWRWRSSRTPATSFSWPSPPS